MSEVVNGKIEEVRVPDFTMQKEDTQKRVLSRIEVENIKNMIKGEPIENQRIMVSVLPTDLLREELKRRDDILNEIITSIKDFASTVRTQDELKDKQTKIEEFRRTMASALL